MLSSTIKKERLVFKPLKTFYILLQIQELQRKEKKNAHIHVVSILFWSSNFCDSSLEIAACSELFTRTDFVNVSFSYKILQKKFGVPVFFIFSLFDPLYM